MTQIDYKEVPYDWALCFQNDCPMASTCLRFVAGEQIPEKVTRHMAVMRGARKGSTCSMYREAKTVTIAYGMTNLFNGLSREVTIGVRDKVMNLFGSRAHFYRYRAGKYPIGPDIQEKINRIFTKYNIKHPAKFDRTLVSFDFYSH
ncbi:MAG: DUF6078 family protein [Bacteroidaceae bacterium]|nr:DUF6078 family protein [Bacteroidaceae bacterium]